MSVPGPSQSATPLPKHQFGLERDSTSRYSGTRSSRYQPLPATGSRDSSGVAATGSDAVAAPDTTKCPKNQHGSGVAAKRTEEGPPAEDTAAPGDPEAF